MKKILLSLIIIASLSACEKSTETKLREFCVDNIMMEGGVTQRAAEVQCECLVAQITQKVDEKTIENYLKFEKQFRKNPLMMASLPKKDKDMIDKYVAASIAASVVCSVFE